MRKFLKKLLRKTPLASYVKMRIIPKSLGVLVANWFFQRVLGINNEMSCLVHFTSQIVQAKNIHLGKNAWQSLFLSGHLYLQGGNGIFIGDNCLIAPGVKIVSADHDPETSDRGWVKEQPIRIGEGSWIGANAVILPGVMIGKHAVIGAGAVVTRDVPDRVIVAGNPARVIRDMSRHD